MQRYIGLRVHSRRRFMAAERCFSHTLGMVPRHLKARENRGLLRWRELDDWAGAIDDFTALLAEHTSYHLAWFYRGMAYCRAGDYYLAAHDLAIFIQRAPNSRWVHHAAIQLEGLYAILDDLPKRLPPTI